MTMIYSRICAVAAAAMLAATLSVGAFAQQQQQSGDQGNRAPLGYQQAAATTKTPPGPAGGTRPLEVPVLYVTGIEVLHATLDPKIDVIRVTGLVSSAGWSGPELVPFFYGKPADDILDLQFIATSPEQSQKAEGFMRDFCRFHALEPGHTPFKGVRVRAYGNALELKQMTGSAQARGQGERLQGMRRQEVCRQGAGPSRSGHRPTLADLPRRTFGRSPRRTGSRGRFTIPTEST